MSLSTAPSSLLQGFGGYGIGSLVDGIFPPPQTVSGQNILMETLYCAGQIVADGVLVGTFYDFMTRRGWNLTGDSTKGTVFAATFIMGQPGLTRRLRGIFTYGQNRLTSAAVGTLSEVRAVSPAAQAQPPSSLETQLPEAQFPHYGHK